jgi:hypothetical protein
MSLPIHTLVSACEAEGLPSRTVGTDATPCGPSDAAHGSTSVQDVTDPTQGENWSDKKVPRLERFF